MKFSLLIEVDERYTCHVIQANFNLARLLELEILSF